MIIFDVETTGKIKPNVVDLKLQPKIIEFAGIKLDDKTLKEVDRLEFLVNPKEKLSKEIIKLTNITDGDLIDKECFEAHYQKLIDFFIGERYLIAHNIAFDINMLTYELARIGRLKQFPYPPVQICTVNKTEHFRNYRLKLIVLYNHLFNEEFKEAHRAMKDVEALTRCVLKLIDMEVIKL